MCILSQRSWVNIESRGKLKIHEVEKRTNVLMSYVGFNNNIDNILCGEQQQQQQQNYVYQSSHSLAPFIRVCWITLPRYLRKL